MTVLQYVLSEGAWK